MSRILQLGDPLLRSVSVRVSPPAEAVPVLRELRETLRAFRTEHGFGRGISAVQIGVPKRLIYLEFEGTPYSLLNPEFVSRGMETFELWDDCFSFPGLMVRVERAVSVAVRYEDEAGAFRTLEASGALSELLQHEMDHLDGVLAIDRAIDRNSLATREEYLRRFATAAQSGASNTYRNE